ncbi:hypothetical protein SNEBB_006171 [Seison nebaliae]|nr:hypothetical protein SNEBB_006171 [Seison nebaliae]
MNKNEEKFLCLWTSENVGNDLFPTTTGKETLRLCHDLFDNLEELIEHLIQSHIYTIENEMKINERRQLEEFQEYYDDSSSLFRNLSCNWNNCAKEFTISQNGIDDLEKHLLNEHIDGKSYRCIFNQPNNFPHSTSIESSKNSKCPKRFITSTQLQEHIINDHLSNELPVKNVKKEKIERKIMPTNDEVTKVKIPNKNHKNDKMFVLNEILNKSTSISLQTSMDRRKALRKFCSLNDDLLIEELDELKEKNNQNDEPNIMQLSSSSIAKKRNKTAVQLNLERAIIPDMFTTYDYREIEKNCKKMRRMNELAELHPLDNQKELDRYYLKENIEKIIFPEKIWKLLNGEEEGEKSFQMADRHRGFQSGIIQVRNGGIIVRTKDEKSDVGKLCNETINNAPSSDFCRCPPEIDISQVAEKISMYQNHEEMKKKRQIYLSLIEEQEERIRKFIEIWEQHCGRHFNMDTLASEDPLGIYIKRFTEGLIVEKLKILRVVANEKGEDDNKIINLNNFIRVGEWNVGDELFTNKQLILNESKEKCVEMGRIGDPINSRVKGAGFKFPRESIRNNDLENRYYMRLLSYFCNYINSNRMKRNFRYSRETFVKELSDRCPTLLYLMNLLKVEIPDYFMLSSPR